MRESFDQQLIDYKAMLATHITPEFAAAVPIMEYMLEEGVKVFTNMHMNWKGIQGIPLFELGCTTCNEALSKRIFWRLQKKNLIDYVVICSFHPTVHSAAT